MSNRSLVLLGALAILALPGEGRAGEGWSLTLSAWGGVSRYDVLGLGHGLGTVGAADGRDLMEGRFDALGTSALLRVGWLDLGLLYEGTLVDKGATSDVLTPVVGFAWNPTGRVRLDVLAELGGHRIADVGAGNPVAAATRTVWLPYFGVRPSLSLRVPFGPTHLVLSATPFARWDLVTREVAVPVSGGTETVYEAGGTTFGLVGGVGIEL